MTEFEKYIEDTCNDESIQGVFITKESLKEMTKQYKEWFAWYSRLFVDEVVLKNKDAAMLP